MRLTDILQPETVKVFLDATTKKQAIFELVDLLSDKVGIQDREELKKAVWEREQTRTTGIGHGIGIPHGKSMGVDHLCMAVGRPKEPIEFGSIDGRPVDLVILLASPMDQTGPHIQALAKISRVLTDESFRHALRASQSAEVLYQLILEHESQAAAKT